MTDVIRLENVSKSFGAVKALDGLDLDVAEGEVHGFLGPNGAGKTTTIRILLGLYRPSSGHAQLFGAHPWRHPADLHRRLAYVPGEVNLWPALTGGEAIDLLIRLRGGSVRRSARERLIEEFDFDPTKRIRSYSKGNRQKVVLIAAFAHQAELYILDEPTSGLDPLMAQRFQSEVMRVTGEGSSVLLSSHILAEVEQVADRLSIIRRGRRVETGTLDEVGHLAHTEYVITDPLQPDKLAQLREIADDVRDDAGTIRFTVEPGRTAEVLRLLADAEVTGFTAQRSSLEQAFLRHYGDDAAGQATTAGTLP
ncbi:ABC transporter ATP-binding protein [Propionimicrobium sp. PCR01-08-3]|uniref:ABC transporter ATP-binding protein n=1 Tax=Propionimicrobium sp. PCR01-08-3 TaxID=3052086 RepID=UPI00255C76B8|nr:ABC transporter ATP-binding protein [Propionimicrobium sp. PCR01-08-3]WIY82511.1 ABC transporter ATP-binding protein [Propionimicrobium sp. PCR01-08-3]